MPFLLALERGFFSVYFKFIRAVAPTGVRGRRSSGSCDLQTFLKGVPGSLRGCASTQVNQPRGVSAKRRGGCVGRKSRRQFKLSGRQKSGYYFKFIRAVAQLGSALVSGTRGPGFKSRRPDLNFGKRTGSIGQSS